MSGTCRIAGCERPRGRLRTVCETHHSRSRRGLPADFARPVRMPRICRVWFVTCVWCGRLFTARSAATKSCSRACGWRAGYVARTQVDKSARPCRRCGIVFAPSFGDKRRVFCSEDCIRRFRVRTPRRRAASKANARVLRLLRQRRSVTCGICGTAVDLELRWPHELSLTVDHVVPVSAGGTDDDRNLQAAHWRCNRDKSDDLGWDRLLLAGRVGRNLPDWVAR